MNLNGDENVADFFRGHDDDDVDDMKMEEDFQSEIFDQQPDFDTLPLAKSTRSSKRLEGKKILTCQNCEKVFRSKLFYERHVETCSVDENSKRYKIKMT